MRMVGGEESRAECKKRTCIMYVFVWSGSSCCCCPSSHSIRNTCRRGRVRVLFAVLLCELCVFLSHNNLKPRLGGVGLAPTHR